MFDVFIYVCCHKHLSQTQVLFTRVLLSSFGCGETPCWWHAGEEVCVGTRVCEYMTEEWRGEVPWHPLGQWLEQEVLLLISRGVGDPPSWKSSPAALHPPPPHGGVFIFSRMPTSRLT